MDWSLVGYDIISLCLVLEISYTTIVRYLHRYLGLAWLGLPAGGFPQWVVYNINSKYNNGAFLSVGLKSLCSGACWC